jgi:hypothetical protein
MRPKLIAAGAPLIPGEPRPSLGPSIGVFLHLVSIALLAAVTIGIFFGIAFSLLRPPATPPLSEGLLRGHNGDVVTPPLDGSAAAGGAAFEGSKAAPAPAKTAQSPRLDVAAATPGPPPKTVASVHTKAGAQIPAAPHLPDRQLAELLTRGNAFLRAGDVASARLFYERASEAGDGQAALRMGATFDPAFLASAGLRNLHGDPVKARFWYHRALGLGANDAEPRLNSLETK